MRAGHNAKRLTGRAMTRPATATTPTTGVAAGAVALDAVRSAATTIAAARPSGSTRTPLTRSPDARSTRRPQPAPMAASRMGNRTHETARDNWLTDAIKSLRDPARYEELLELQQEERERLPNVVRDALDADDEDDE